jgi:DNA-binding transcriptional ArsR family regulator
MDKKLNLLKSKQDECFLLMSKIISSFSSPVRLKLIHFLSQSPLSVEVLSQKIDQSIANTSMHLRKMLSDKVVKVEVVGTKRLYSLKPELKLFWEQSQDFCFKIDSSLKLPVEEIYGDINWNLPEKDTLSLLKNKEAILIDVRPEDERPLNIEKLPDYVLHIPASQLKDRMNELPRRKKILIMCRGRLCALSAQTVHLLRANDYKAYRLDKSWFLLSDSFKWDLV